MSSRYNIGFVDPKGILIFKPGVGALLASGRTVPADGATGYSPGCIFVDEDAASGSQMFTNTGTAASCAFRGFGTQTALVNATAATLTVTQALHANRTVTLNRATGIAVALPAATGTGDYYTFYIGTTITSTNVTTFTAAGSDKFYGQVYQLADGGSTLAGYEAPGATIITLGTSSNTTGGTRGDSLQFQDVGAAEWWLVSDTTAAGSEATPVT